MSDDANILLVDDEPGMLRYIRTLLEVDSYKVETASTGEEALDRVQKGLQPDLVLLDVLMPGIDGLQTLEQLRQMKPSVKVVANCEAFLFQRPESHCVHHQSGVHSYNYADLPLWDMLFGTFRNPVAWKKTCGFKGNAEARVLDMFRGKDVAA